MNLALKNVSELKAAAKAADDGTAECLLVKSEVKAWLVCGEQISEFKDFRLNQHYETKARR